MTQEPFSVFEMQSPPTLVRFEPEYSAVCSLGHAPFSGKVTIEYRPVSNLLEFESFERWLHGQANDSFTIESLATHVYNELHRALASATPLRVTVSATTTRHAPALAVCQSPNW